MVTLYRIIDADRCGQILANRIPDLVQAQEILTLLQKDYPNSTFEIESYTSK
jgi:hypothetical protein